jgi:hypothetical protein
MGVRDAMSMTWDPPAPSATPSWQSGDAWMNNGFLYLGSTTPPARIPVDQIDNILITDASYRKTPGWAVALGVLGIFFFFLIGIVFFFVKETVPRAMVTIYVRGTSTPVTTLREAAVGQVQTEWYPVQRQIGNRS